MLISFFFILPNSPFQTELRETQARWAIAHRESASVEAAVREAREEVLRLRAERDSMLKNVEIQVNASKVEFEKQSEETRRHYKHKLRSLRDRSLINVLMTSRF